jgi:hypothetical protein
MARTKVWSVANWTMAALFVFSIVVQFNDPDPFRWMLIYALAAAVCVLEARRGSPWAAAAAVGSVALIAAFWIANGLDMVPVADLFAQWEMRDTQVEETREVGGLWIIAGWMLPVTLVAWRRSRRRAGRMADLAG